MDFSSESVNFAIQSMTYLLLTSWLQQLKDADTQLLLSINAHHSPFWDVFMSLYSSTFVWAFFYASILYVIVKNYSWKTTLMWLIAVILIIVFCDQLSSHVIRPAVARLRPSNLDNPISDTVHIVDGYRGGNYSFPSAHAANSWGLAAFVIILFRKWWLSLTLVIWAILNCYSRMYLGLHYPGDLFTGMIIGCLGALAFYYLLMWIAKIQKPKELKHTFVPLIALGISIFTFMAISFYETC